MIVEESATNRVIAFFVGIVKSRFFLAKVPMHLTHHPSVIRSPHNRLLFKDATHQQSRSMQARTSQQL